MTIHPAGRSFASILFALSSVGTPLGAQTVSAASMRLLSDSVVANAPKIELAEEIRIGVSSGDPDLEFGAIQDVAVSEDGEIYVLDEFGMAVRVFAPDGSFVRRWGTRGDGPSDLRYPTRFEVFRDTVVILDEPYVKAFSNDGEVRSVVLQNLPDTSPVRVGRWGEGWGVEMRRRSRTSAGGSRTDLILTRVDFANEAMGEPVEVLDHPARRDTVIETGPASSLNLSHFLIHRPSVAFTMRDHVWIVPDEYYHLQRMNAVAEIDVDVAGSVPRRRIGREFINDRWPPDTRTATDETMLELPAPDGVPTFDRAISSTNGGVMIVRRDLIDGAFYGSSLPTLWDLFDSEGALVGRVSVPENIRPMRLTDSGILAVARDDFDIEYVVRYRFVRN